MFRFIVGSDWHLRSTRPAVRTDDFYEAQFVKLHKVFSYADYYKCPVIHSGDLFDIYNPPLTLITRVISEWDECNRPQLFVNPGNHDLYGASLEARDKTALGVLWAAGVVKVPLHGAEFLMPGETTHDYFNPEKKVKLRIYPYNIHFDSNCLVQPESKDPVIIVTHGMITSHPILNSFGLPLYEHYPVQTLYSNADVVVCGHWHGQFVIKQGDALFLNPGPLTRQTKNEVKMKPQVYLVTIKSKYNVKVESLSLPHEEFPFDVTEKGSKLQLAEEGIAEQFLSVISESQLEMSDVFHLVKEIGVKANFTDNTIQRATTTLQDVHFNWER